MIATALMTTQIKKGTGFQARPFFICAAGTKPSADLDETDVEVQIQTCQGMIGVN